MKENAEGVSAGSNADKFKIGDRVKYIGTSSYDDLNTGDVKVITHIRKHLDSDEIYGVNLDGVDGYVYPQNLRLVECCDDLTVEDVIEALMYVYPEGWSDTKEQVIADTKAELEKRKNPEYLKYLELKEKFEPSTF